MDEHNKPTFTRIELHEKGLHKFIIQHNGWTVAKYNEEDGLEMIPSYIHMTEAVTEYIDTLKHTDYED